MKDKTELKPCPFCGKRPRLFEIFSNPSRTKSSGWCIECKCGISITGRTVEDDWTKAYVLKMWNTRTQPPATDVGWISAEGNEKPKKHTRVFVLLKNLIRGVAVYIPYKSVLSDDFLSEECEPGCEDWYDEKKDVYWVNEGWWEDHISGVSDAVYRIADVTHWRPLPNPPKDSGPCKNPNCKDGTITRWRSDSSNYEGPCPGCQQ